MMPSNHHSATQDFLRQDEAPERHSDGIRVCSQQSDKILIEEVTEARLRTEAKSKVQTAYLCPWRKLLGQDEMPEGHSKNLL